jgi:anthranilate synthase/phosphoribosyltransferase
MILLIDNYDSFTYNLFQYLSELGADVLVKRNDEVTLDEVERMRPEKIVISPGPGRPEQAGIIIDLIKKFKERIPILGVCLGHQAIGEAFGGKVVRAPVLMHGKTSEIRHDGKGLFTGIRNPFIATRYHSLMVERQGLPEELEISAVSEDGSIMGFRHRKYPCDGIQFHPESIMTDQGKALLSNFIYGPGKVQPQDHPVKTNKTVSDADFRKVMEEVIAGKNLGEEEMYGTVLSIMNGEFTDIQTAGFLSALRSKGETIAEITGAARAMLEKAVKIRSSAFAVDTCGTGGDMSHTFNISTASAIVAAGAGVTVVKHGNRSVTSLCGSSDAFEALGVNIKAAPEVMEKAVNTVGIGFCFAPAYHPAMKFVGPARQGLKIRTIFNILGPLTNPASARGRVMGVFDTKLLDTLPQVLLGLGVERGFVLHSEDGLDEISLNAKTRMMVMDKGRIHEITLDPSALGFVPAGKDELRGSDAAGNARLIRAILSGEKSARRDIVVLNAAAAVIAGDKADNFGDAVLLAEKSIDSGTAMAKLEALCAITKGHP